MQGFDSTDRNGMGSLANWLETRSHMRSYEDCGGLMREYAVMVRGWLAAISGRAPKMTRQETP